MTSLKRDLFERRLWPLVIVIVVAIVAVPLVLHSHKANADVPAPPASTTAPGAPATSSGSKRAEKRKTHTTPTSRTRDPFAEAGVTKQRSSAASSSVSSTTTVTPVASAAQSAAGSSSSGSSGTSVTASAGGTPSSPASASQTTTPVLTPTATPPATKKRTTNASTVTRSPKNSKRAGSATRSWDIYSVDVRVGAVGASRAHRNIARLTPLPTERSPQVMYMGVTDHGRDAVFALGAGVEVRALTPARSAGAACDPSRLDCALVVIPAGRTVGLSYVSATGKVRTMVLRVTRITSRVTQSARDVRVARRHVSTLGMCDLKLGDPIGFFDPTDDNVKILSTRACRSRKLAVPFPGSLGAGSSERG